MTDLLPRIVPAKMSKNAGLKLFDTRDELVVRAAAGKRLFYLDHNIWIDLTERHPAVAKQCRNAVLLRNLLFPVSTATVGELLEQTDATQRCNVATLMDDLCKGVSFRPTSLIHCLEADLSFAVLFDKDATSIRRDKILCWVSECFGAMRWEFPPSWNQSMADDFRRFVARQTDLRSVRWLVEHFPVDERREKQPEREKRFVERMTASIDDGVDLVKGLPKNAQWPRLLLEERLWVFKKHIQPRFLENVVAAVGIENALETMDKLLERIGPGSEQRFDQLMRLMPSLDLFCHIMAGRRRDPRRKVYKQDFYDVEHAIAGIYADVFVTSDGHLFDLLTRRCSIPAARGCQVVKGVAGLEEALKL